MSQIENAEDHHRSLERMYVGAAINRSIPSQINVADGQAEVSMKVSEDFWHSGYAMHGSMYFKGLDDAAFFAAQSVVTRNLILTVKFEIELLGMVRCETLTAKGSFNKQEGRKLWACAELFDDDSRLVARGKGLFLVSDISFSETTGYHVV